MSGIKSNFIPEDHPHIYKDLEHAKSDLKLFSRMFINENSPLYLMINSEGGYIEKNTNNINSANANLISAIAINGVLFQAKA